VVDHQGFEPWTP